MTKCVYKITNNLTKQFYIGATLNFEKRYFHWRDFSSCLGSKLKSDILKYGRDNFYFEIVEQFNDNANKKDVFDRELYYIHTLKPYYNTIGKPRSDETKIKLSNALKGRKPPKEQVEKMTNSLRKRYEQFPRTNEKHLKQVIIVEENKVIKGVKNVATYLGVHPSSVTKAIKRSGKVKNVHVKLFGV